MDVATSPDTNMLTMLERTKVTFWGFLVWGFVLPNGSNLHPWRVRKMLDSVEPCSDALISRACLEEAVSTESTSRANQLSSLGTWVGLSSPHEYPSYAVSLASLAGRGGAWVEEAVFGPPEGGQTWISGSAMVHIVCSAKRSKHIYFWHRTVLCLCTSSTWVSSLTIWFATATPRPSDTTPLGKTTFQLPGQLSLLTGLFMIRHIKFSSMLAIFDSCVMK